MKKKITKNIRFFQAVKTMDKKKVFRKLKERRQQRKKNRMVKEILGMIKDISEQITLLTLNASIEAAEPVSQEEALRWWRDRCASWWNRPARPPEGQKKY